MAEERVHARRAHEQARCPYCLDGLVDLEAVVACAACGARHHGACHDEHGSCAACGAIERLVPRAIADREAAETVEGVSFDPPRGSRIRIEREGDTITYRWGDQWVWRDLLRILVASMICPPLGPIIALFIFVMLLYRVVGGLGYVRLGPESLEVGGAVKMTFLPGDRRPAVRRARPAEVTRIRLGSRRSNLDPPRISSGSTVDVEQLGHRSSETLFVALGDEEVQIGEEWLLVGGGLTPIELEWLAQVLLAWKTGVSWTSERQAEGT